MSSQATSLPAQETRPLVIDGLNCAAVTRDQFERTLQGGISAINLTAVQPWSDLPKSLKELEANLCAIEALDDIAGYFSDDARVVDDQTIIHQNIPSGCSDSTKICTEAC